MMELTKTKSALLIFGFCLLLGFCFAWGPSADASYSLGNEALRSGDYVKALEHFERALGMKTETEKAQAGLLETLREVGRYEEAQKRADEFLALQEKSPRVHFEKGRSAKERGDYPLAEKHLRRALVLGGEIRRSAVRELGTLLEETGRLPEAQTLWQQLVDDYRKGVVRGSQDLGNVAVAAWRLGWAHDAKDIFIDATSGEGVSLESLALFGFLFLEKYDATNAMGVFRDCLKINKRYPAALLGMALAKKYDSNDEVEKFSREALEVNVNLVPARNLLAELRMQEENYDGAQQELRRALEVNPKDLETLSLTAVYHQYKGDRASFQQTEEKVLGIHPSYGRLYYIVAENLVTRRMYKEAVEFDRKALTLDSKLWPAYTSLGMNLMRIGELDEGRKAIQQAFDGDRFNIWAFNTLDLLDQMDKFSQVRSEHFLFRMAKEDEPVLSRYAPRLAEEVYSKLTQRYGFTPEGPLQVEIFPDHGGFAVRTLGLPGLGALGVCFGKVVALDSPRARKIGSFNWGSTLWHEFAHVITLQMTRHNIPRWFSEGISVYEERRARPGWGDDLTAKFVKAYKDGKLLKVSELNSGMMRPKFAEQIELSYYQASLVCELIEQKFGFAKILQALNLYAENLPTPEVFRRTLGWDEATLDKEYALFLEGRLRDRAEHVDFNRLVAEEKAFTTKEGVKEILEKYPDDFFANLHLGLFLRRDKLNKEAEVYLKKAQLLFPEFVEATGNPYQALIEIYLEEKREDDALAQIEAWTRFDENAAPPLIRAAEIFRNRKNWAETARMLELSMYINPYDISTHTMFGEAATETRNWPAAVTAYQVLVAMDPADPAGAHLNLARAWLGNGKKQEAKRETLRALEIAPGFLQAQELLLKLTAQ
jgi:tetratricopeptide (TPR) repeat protein